MEASAQGPRERAGASAPSRSGTTLLASFGHAGRGLVHVAARERNMKIHVVAGITAGLAGSALPLPLAGRLALVGCVGLVIAAEALNSALEALVDLHTRERRPEARVVKDAAAGAVLALAVGAVIVGAFVFWAGWNGLSPAARPSPQAVVTDLTAILAAAVLLLPGGRPVALDVAAVVGGCAALASAGLRSLSPPLTAMSALLFALAVAASVERRKGG